MPGSMFRTVLGGLIVTLASGASRPELVLQTGHSLVVSSLAFSPDGQYLVSASYDGTAILWEVSTGRQLRTYRGHTGNVFSVAFSHDGKQIFTGALDSLAILWDVRSGRQLRSFRISIGGMADWFVPAGTKLPVWSVALAPDGRQSLVSGLMETILWNTETGREVRRFKEEGVLPRSVAFSPDGRTIVTGGYGKPNPPVILWDVESGRKLRELVGHAADVTAVAFSADGKHIASASLDKTAALWDVTSGRRLQHLQGHRAQIWSAAFSPGGAQVVTASPMDGTVRVWDSATGTTLHTFRPQGRFGNTDNMPWSVTFSPDGRLIAVGTGSTSITLWDSQSGNCVQRLEGYGMLAKPVAFLPGDRQALAVHGTLGFTWDAQSGRPALRLAQDLDVPQMANAIWTPDGHWTLLLAKDGSARLFDSHTGKCRKKFEAFSSEAFNLACTSDGRQALSESDDKSKAWLWDVAAGKPVDLVHGDPIGALALSGDGHWALTASVTAARVWDARAQRRVHELSYKFDFANAAVFSADGRQLLTGSGQGEVALWDVAAGKRLRTFAGMKTVVLCVGFSPDGSRVFAGGMDGGLRVWNAESGGLVKSFIGHAVGVTSAAVSPDGKFLLSGSFDGTARLWNLAGGYELGRLIGLLPSMSGDLVESQKRLSSTLPDWLVITPDGLFDGSPDARQKASYRVGGELNLAPVDRFFQDFYRPGLLDAIWSEKRVASTVELFRNEPPVVRVISPAQDGEAESNRRTLEIEAVDQGGGVQGPWLTHNGARLLARGSAERQDGRVLRRFDVALIEGQNRLEARAASADGSWESEPAVRVLRYNKPLEKPVLHLISVGISDYAAPGFRLKYARRDAEAILDLFRRRSSALYESAELVGLFDAHATRAAIRKTMEQVTGGGRPQDTLLLYVAGHGTLIGQRYYFIPHDFQARPGKRLEDDVREQGLPVDLLTDFLGAGRALKRMLILDTCAAGAAVELFQVASRNPFALRGEIERLSRAQGLYMLTASAASEEAKESDLLGHGVLTYALLAGLRAVDKGPLNHIAAQPSSPDQVVDVLEWFSFASGHVPRLTKELCGQEQTVQMGGRGNSFPVLPLAER